MSPRKIEANREFGYEGACRRVLGGHKLGDLTNQLCRLRPTTSLQLVQELHQSGIATPPSTLAAKRAQLNELFSKALWCH